LKDFPKSVKDYLVSGETFKLVYDERYKMLVTSPQPFSKNLGKYYDSEDYISHTDSKKGLLQWAYQIVKRYSLSKKVELIKKRNGSVGSVLDIGAGTGNFLKRASDKGWEVHGVEPNKKARTYAEQKQIDLKEHITDFKGKQFDVVTLWHVLEHLPDLDNIVSQIESLVKPGGVLLIAVPNFNSYDASYYKEFWAAYDVPRHLWHFSQKSMKLIFSGEMNLEKIKPMLFDSFYVSLLSEKYKCNKGFSLKAILVGLCSNMSALHTKEYSSLIYCFKRAK